MTNAELLPDAPARPGFKLYRKPLNTFTQKGVHRVFKQTYPGHLIYAYHGAEANLLSRRETGQFMDSSRLLQQLPTEDTIRQVLRKGRRSTKTELKLPSTIVQYEKYLTPSGNRKIVLGLDDREGILEEERESYLRALGNLAAIELPDKLFVPRIEIGHLKPDSPHSAEALQFLAHFISDQIWLGRVRSDPQVSLVKNWTAQRPKRELQIE